MNAMKLLDYNKGINIMRNLNFRKKGACIIAIFLVFASSALANSPTSYSCSVGIQDGVGAGATVYTATPNFALDLTTATVPNDHPLSTGEYAYIQYYNYGTTYQITFEINDNTNTKSVAFGMTNGSALADKIILQTWDRTQNRFYTLNCRSK